MNFGFSLLQEWEYQYKKIDEKTIATKLRETILIVSILYIKATD